jgi:hypothetical protein
MYPSILIGGRNGGRGQVGEPELTVTMLFLGAHYMPAKYVSKLPNEDRAKHVLNDDMVQATQNGIPERKFRRVVGISAFGSRVQLARESRHGTAFF